MDETLPCPGCHTPLPPEATGCQVCMRARSKQEIVRGYTQLREEKARRKRRPFKIAAAILIIGGAGKLGWEHQAALHAAAHAVKARASAWFDQFTDAKNYAPAGSEESPVASSTAAAVAAPTKSPFATTIDVPAQYRDTNTPASSAPGAASRPAQARTPAAATKTPVAKNAWRVSGVVYDLSTLRPVSDTQISFLRDGKEPATVKTDRDGAYEIDLVKADDWTVSMQAPDMTNYGSVVNTRWRRGQLIDIDPPYRQRDADERRATLEHISDGDLAPTPVSWKRSSARVHLDLIAVTERWVDLGPR